VLLGGLAQVLALGLGLLDLRKELLLQLDGGLSPRRQREREAERGHPDRVAHGGNLARLLSRSASRGASTPRQQGSSRFEPAVLSLEEDEGRATPELGVLDGADVDHVVSPLVRLDDATLDVAERPVEHRCAQPTEVVGDAGELVAAGLGEARRERFLVLGQDVHDEAFRIEEVRVALGRLVDADEEERWDEGERRDRVGGEPVEPAAAIAGGDDGHAGGEEAHHPAQLLRVEHGPRQSAGVYAMRIRLPSLKPARNFSSKRAQPSGYLLCLSERSSSGERAAAATAAKTRAGIGTTNRRARIAEPFYPIRVRARSSPSSDPPTSCSTGDVSCSEARKHLKPGSSDSTKVRASFRALSRSGVRPGGPAEWRRCRESRA